MYVEAWLNKNDMLVRAAFEDATPVVVTGLAAAVTMQHPDETAVTINAGAGFTWPLTLPEVGTTGVYEMEVDRNALDLAVGDKVRFIVDLTDGAGLELNWVRVGVVLERTGA